MAEARSLLGGELDQVAVDLRERLDLDLLGAAHGLVRRGGELVLWLPKTPRAGRMEDRLRRAIGRGLPWSGEVAQGAPLDEQDAAVERLRDRVLKPGFTAVIADRGRGKSAALGRVIRWLSETRPDVNIALVAPTADGAAVIQQFAGFAVSVASPAEVLRSGRPADVLFVDEAASIAVPVLQALVRSLENRHVVFATTVHGYEGTGRGFALRLLPSLPEVEQITLRHPIRWDPGDPLERWIFDLLLLDAEPAASVSNDPVDAAVVDPDLLASDEGLLRECFGLLVGAHYRTTPSDLHRLLDARELRLHALSAGGRVVGVCLVSLEGGLSQEQSHDIAFGRGRIRGHALADTLVCHGGRVEAGPLAMVRSIRTAIHPALRGRGLGRQLVEHVHRSYDPDLFGTLFGAEAGLVRFRQALGYQVVRVGASAGTRTGLPAAVMVRPVSEAARDVVHALREDLARDLDRAMAAVTGELALPVDPGLHAALASDLPEPRAPSSEQVERAVRAWANGPRPFESAATMARIWLQTTEPPLERLEPGEHQLIRAKVIEGRPWHEVSGKTGSVRAAMRALRRAFQKLL